MIISFVCVLTIDVALTSGVEDEARRGIVNVLSECTAAALPDSTKDRVISNPQLGLGEFLASWQPGFKNFWVQRNRVIDDLKGDASMSFPFDKHSREVMIKFLLRKEMEGWSPNFDNYDVSRDVSKEIETNF